MYIAGRIKVGMALVVTNGAAKELAPTALDPLPRQQAEPHPFGSTTGTILRRAMGIDFLCRPILHSLNHKDSSVEAAGSYNAALDLSHTALWAESEGERYTGVL